jgi:xylan 1,4-beta-xylosidase
MTNARSDWQARIGRPSGDAGGVKKVVLPAPAGLWVAPGRGQVTLNWWPVDGAAGYLVRVASSPDGPSEPLDHGGRDVLAVPHGPYVDTTGHLSHLLCADLTGGRPIGAELKAALRAAHDVLGVETVRAHAILCDDLGVYRELAGRIVHDFEGIDRVYDTVLELGLRPIVELSFMPRDLAGDPTKTVFEYQAVVSPPKDWDRWHELVRDLTEHLVDRYGRQELVDRWAFDV